MISLGQLKLLKEAVDEAESWRGMHVGSAPDWYLEAFDKKIADMRKAVKAAKEDRKKLIEFSSKYLGGGKAP